jgi:ERCC4-type nuclease
MVQKIALVVDTREHAVIDALKQKLELYPDLFTLDVRPLNLGDWELYYDDQLLFIWERKTFRDLLSSIKDGRYAEQSYRLLHNYEPSKLVYLIEGIFSQLQPIEKQTVVSCMTSISLMKKMHLWRTTHVQDTVEQLLLCCKKIQKEFSNPKNRFSTPVYTNPNNQNETEPNAKQDHSTNTTNISTTTTTTDQVSVPYSNFVIKKEKRENITRENIGVIFLKQIPGISNTTAVGLMDYAQGDFHKLLELVKTNITELSSIKIGKRRIGKNVIEQLTIFLQ